MRQIRDTGAGLVILDPLAALFGVKDENDAAEVVQHTRKPLQRIIQETGAAPIVVHHSSKHYQRDEPFSAQDLVRGSGDLIAMTGSVLGLWFSKKQRVVKALVTGRLNPPPPFRLVMAEETGDPKHIILDFDAAGIHPLAWGGSWEKSEQSVGTTLEAARTLDTEGQPITLTRLVKATDLSKTTVSRHCEALTQRGLLIRRAGSPGWALSDGGRVS